MKTFQKSGKVEAANSAKRSIQIKEICVCVCVGVGVWESKKKKKKEDTREEKWEAEEETAGQIASHFLSEI